VSGAEASRRASRVALTEDEAARSVSGHFDGCGSARSPQDGGRFSQVRGCEEGALLP
jgi:hypothetical protein